MTTQFQGRLVAGLIKAFFLVATYVPPGTIIVNGDRGSRPKNASNFESDNRLVPNGKTEAAGGSYHTAATKLAELGNHSWRK